MAFGAPLVVNAEPRVSNPHGLFSVITLREASDSHWQNGIEWEHLTCSAASGFTDPTCTPSGGTVAGGEFPKSFAAPGTGEASPFTVYGSYKCGSFGRSMQAAQDMAMAHLLAREEAAVERQLWAQMAAEATALSGSAVSPATGLALLEGWLGASYGSQGVIHASRAGGSILGTANGVKSSGGRLLTNVGTPVVAGAGNPGTAPAGGAAPSQTETWLFASPAVFGYRSQVFEGGPVKEILDRSTNDQYAVSERTYVVGFDPCGVAAIRVTLECC